MPPPALPQPALPLLALMPPPASLPPTLPELLLPAKETFGHGSYPAPFGCTRPTAQRAELTPQIAPRTRSAPLNGGCWYCGAVRIHGRAQ
eukprot:gene8929-biopygen3083